jgi:hypothetical protein
MGLLVPGENILFSSRISDQLVFVDHLFMMSSSWKFDHLMVNRLASLRGHAVVIFLAT